MFSNRDTGLVWEQILRTLGFGATIGFFGRFQGRRHNAEEKKIVISRSWRLAAARCTIHVLPTLVSIAIIYINVRGVFIGVDFNSRIRSESINVAFLQIAAKLQELAVIASLASVTFQLLRHELMHGDGLPLGLVVAGFEFSKLSYFFSPELLGSLKHVIYGTAKLRKLFLILFLILVGGLAVVIGPSCAVLLVPQSQDWPAGTAEFEFNVPKSTLWPATLEAPTSDDESACLSPEAVGHSLCPSGGFRSLWAHHVQTNVDTFRNIVPNYAKRLSGADYYFSTRNAEPVSTNSITLGIWNDPAIFIQPHVGIAAVLEQLMQRWWTRLKAKHRLKDENVEDRAAICNIRSAMTQVRCGSPTQLPAAGESVTFPSLTGDTIHERNLTTEGINILPTAHLQFSWLPPTELASHSVAAVFQSPWITDNTSRVVVGCVLQANWVQSQVHTDAYSFWQGFYSKNITFDDVYPRIAMPLFEDTDRKSPSNSIAIRSSWLAQLTPKTPPDGPGYRSWGPSTIESILEDVHVAYDSPWSRNVAPIDLWKKSNDRIAFLISVIGSVFNDGLARSGLQEIYDGRDSPTFNESNSSSDIQGARVDFSISGLSYRLTLASILAILALSTHIFIAIAHTVWMLRKRQSSGCWDSVTEILVLAQNSKPAHSALKNTAAGIKNVSTYAKKVIIRPTRSLNGDSADHLEMIYEEETYAKDHDEYEVPPMVPTDCEVVTTGSQEMNASFGRTLHASTWPSTHVTYSKAVSRQSNQSAIDEVSMSDSPLLSTFGVTTVPPTQTVTRPEDARVKVDNYYG